MPGYHIVWKGEFGAKGSRQQCSHEFDPLSEIAADIPKRAKHHQWPSGSFHTDLRERTIAYVRSPDLDLPEMMKQYFQIKTLKFINISAMHQSYTSHVGWSSGTYAVSR